MPLMPPVNLQSLGEALKANKAIIFSLWEFLRQKKFLLKGRGKYVKLSVEKGN
jgi:hypothetical protein